MNTPILLLLILIILDLSQEHDCIHNEISKDFKIQQINFLDNLENTTTTRRRMSDP